MKRHVARCALAYALSFSLAAVSLGPARAQTPEIEKLQDLLGQGKAKEAHALAEELAKKAPDDGMSWFLLARARHADGDLPGAIEAGTRAVEFPGVRASAYYNLACAYALLGRADDAFAALSDAKRAGFMNSPLMSTDPDLESIRNDPRFVPPQERIYDVLDVGDETGLPYSVALPVGFDANKAYPVLVGPGDGDPASALTASLFWGEDSCQRGWIVVESPAFVMEDPVAKTSKLLDHIATIYHVEGGKFHIVGFSANSAGAFAVAAAMPGRFHTVTGVPGYPVVEKGEDLARLKGVVVNFIVGERDEFWLGESRLAHDKLKTLGIETYLEVIPGGGHVLEDLFGGEFMERMDALRSG